MTRLGDVCEKIGSGATPRGGKEAYKDAGIPIIRSQNIHDWVFQPDGLAFLDDEQAESLSNVEVRSNDVLLNITGDSVARACIVPSERIPARVNQHVAIVRAGKEINPTYLLASLQSKKTTLLSLASSGATRNALTKRMIENLDIDLPSREMQDSIAQVLDSIQYKITLNNRLNDYLADLCETIAGKYCNDRNSCLRDICYQVTDHVDYGNANQETYVSTESLMQNKGGRQLASSLPTAGKITRYKAGDTLISNIRPYFKKIWYAPFEGTCSGDVIVFRANDPSNAPYLHACLRQDSFFDYVMQGAKGTKMPRGDKKQMMEFKVASSCSTKDLILLDSAIKQRSDNDSETVKLQALRDTLLPKLMSGEIDVSKVDLTQLTNNHLSDC
ncbi:restriction endonuclease subunit S [Bifidobacterium pseudocatenulatum]|uniref:restriction endonuclease subunit S n=1 Tax=Bifidobacterium pseudocatenulatum TaxID=28026 RepID=UPI0009B8B0ED|nr:restriction endonuclease subunit S [Bifidobacterium pseudocatenulatum]MCB4893987.1 restriction endonuclease subunit S [Bifidobacterium pseudocatenulatum]MCB4899637.1 restriction endonuclease subunit S [Bifidobacterium pseudocatenulatum]